MKKTLGGGFEQAVSTILLLFIFAFSASAITPAVRGTLPSVLRESSGLASVGGPGLGFWTHNDGYGDENLYKVANYGGLEQTIEVLGAVNRDWEDLALDEAGTYMYIGDFGNNACDRTNLKVYRIPNPSNITAPSVTADEISFTYPDQTGFPSPWMNFDVESFFHHDGKLYLFTKTDGNAIGYTKMYSLPDQPGTYVATLVDSFYTNDRTTSADISPDGKSVILIANSRIHLFSNFTGDNFFNGQHTLISISGTWTQKEAISFNGNWEIFMSDEDNGSGAKLYSIDMTPWIPMPTTTSISKAISTEDYTIFPNPANTFFTAQIKSTERIDQSELQLFDLTGQLVQKVSGGLGVSVLRMETAALPAGVYFYKLFTDAREVRTARMVISH